MPAPPRSWAAPPSPLGRRGSSCARRGEGRGGEGEGGWAAGRVEGGRQAHGGLLGLPTLLPFDHITHPPPPSPQRTLGSCSGRTAGRSPRASRRAPCGSASCPARRPQWPAGQGPARPAGRGAALLGRRGSVQTCRAGVGGGRASRAGASGQWAAAPLPTAGGRRTRPSRSLRISCSAAPRLTVQTPAQPSPTRLRHAWVASGAAREARAAPVQGWRLLLLKHTARSAGKRANWAWARSRAASARRQPGVRHRPRSLRTCLVL